MTVDPPMAREAAVEALDGLEAAAGVILAPWQREVVLGLLEGRETHVMVPRCWGQSLVAESLCRR